MEHVQFGIAFEILGLVVKLVVIALVLWFGSKALVGFFKSNDAKVTADREQRKLQAQRTVAAKYLSKELNV